MGDIGTLEGVFQPWDESLTFNDGMLEEIRRNVTKVMGDVFDTYRNPERARILTLADVEGEDGGKHSLNMLKALAVPNNEPRSVDEVTASAMDIFSQRLREDHPRFFGFIPSPVSPLSWLGDSVVSAFNAHAGSWMQSSGPSAIEAALITWLGEKAGLPTETVGGLFVSGGSMANMTALMVARDQKLVTHEERGRGVAYISEQTHYSVPKSLAILGFHANQIRRIPTDRRFRMDICALLKAIRIDCDAELIPFCVIATSGTTNTGSVDDMRTIAKICKQFSMWMHVDGAYGASAAISQTRNLILDGLGLADSIAWDAHKWLFQTCGTGMVLVREKRKLVQSFAMHPEYLRDATATAAEDTQNFWNCGLELTRPARAMKLWFTLQVLGSDTIGQMIDHGFMLAETAERQLRSLPDWDIISPATMAIVNARYNPVNLDKEQVDQLNKEISHLMLQRDLGGLLTTELRGMVVLRMCTISPQLTAEGMCQTIQSLDAIAREVLSNRVGSKG